jgi:hypothetical protein
MKRLVFSLLWLCGVVPVWSQAQALPTAQVSIEDYQRIEAERKRESANFDAQEAACYQRFAVNDCLKKLQTKRIAVMADLKRQETRLHDQERSQQGTDALERIEQKGLEQQRQEDIQAQDGAGRAQEKLQEQQNKQAEHATKAASGPASGSSPAPSGPTDAEHAEARASYERKQIDAEKKRQELIKRQSKQTGKPANSLPIPP